MSIVLIDNTIKELLKKQKQFSNEDWDALSSASKEKNTSIIKQVVAEGLFQSQDLYTHLAAD